MGSSSSFNSIPLAEMLLPCPLILAATASVGEAIAAMQQIQTAGALVYANRQLVGILTAQAVVGAIATHPAESLMQLEIAALTLQPVIALQISDLDDLFAVAAHFQQQRVMLPVVNSQGDCIGVVTPQTFAAAIAGTLQQTLTTQTAALEQTARPGEIICSLMETELRAESKLSVILANAIALSQFHVSLDYRWECCYCSSGCEKIFGYLPEELTADRMLWASRILPKDWKTVLLPAFTEIAAERASAIEFRFRHKNGSLRWVSSHLASQRNSAFNGWVVTCTCTDITDRKRGEAEYLQAEAALWQSEERFSSLIANLVGVVYRCLHDSDWTDLFVSDFVEELSGYPAADFTRKVKTWASVIYPDDRALVAKTVQKAIAARQPFAVEYRILHRDGSIRWICDKGQGKFDLDGNVLYLDGVVFDISDTKRAEAERQQAEANLRLQTRRDQVVTAITQRIRQSLNLNEILNAAVSEVRQFLQVDRVLVYKFAPDWSGEVVVESVSSNALSILGATIHDNCFEYGWHQAYQQGRISAIADIKDCDYQPCYVDLLTRLQVQANLVVPLLQGDLLWGMLVAHHCLAPRLWDWEVDLLRQISIQLAIAIQQSELYQQVQQLNATLEQQVQARTAQLQQALDYEALLKRIIDKVRDSLDEEQILQTAVEELSQVLGGYRSDTCLYDFEQGTLTIDHGYSKEILIPNNTVVQLEDFSDILPQLLAGQSLQFCEIVPRPDAPGWRTTAVLACPIADDQSVLGDLWLFREPEATFSDSEIRLVQQVSNHCAIAIRQSRLYQAAQAQVTELARLNQLKDDFLSSVSHELRTPMSSIKMATQMLEILFDQSGVFEKDQRILQYLQILQDECQREIVLIDDLLDLSRLEAGTEPLVLATVDLKNWIFDIAHPFVERAHSQQQHLQFNLAADLPAFTTDLSYLGRVLIELLHNACKYTPADEAIIISASLIPAAAQPGDTATAALATPAPLFQLSVSNSGIEIPWQERDRVFDKFYRIPSNDPWKHGGTGLGLALVKKRVEHLGGTVEATSGAGWTTFTIHLVSAVQKAIESVSEA